MFVSLQNQDTRFWRRMHQEVHLLIWLDVVEASPAEQYVSRADEKWT